MGDKAYEATLDGNGLHATCIVTVDEDGVSCLRDNTVSPPLPDGEYTLTVNKLKLSAVRKGGDWREQ
jgi:hypothetical protein